MIEPIRLNESRVVNGWIKTAENGYIAENNITQFLVREKRDDCEDRYIGIDVFDDRVGYVEVGYYPFDTVGEKMNAIEMAKQDLDAFVAEHGKLF